MNKQTKQYLLYFLAFILGYYLSDILKGPKLYEGLEWKNKSSTDPRCCHPRSGLTDGHGREKVGASQNSGVCPQGGEWTDLTVKPDSPLGKQGITTYPMPIGPTKSCPCARCDHSGNPYKADSGSVWRGQLLLAQDTIAPHIPVDWLPVT